MPRVRYRHRRTVPTASNVGALANDTAVLVYWNYPNDPDLLVYQVRYAEGSTAPATTTDGTAVATGYANTRYAIHGNRTANTTYSYSVFLQYRTGQISTAASVTVTTAEPPAVPDTTPPAACSSLTSNVGITDIQFAWSNPTDSDLDYIAVRYTTGATAPADKSAGTKVDNIKAPGHSVTVTGLSPSTEYSFLFTAVDTSGNARDSSTALTATVTTDPLPYVTPPGTIDRTGTTDVTSDLATWIDAQTTTIQFPAGARYRCDDTLTITKTGLTIDGNGATIDGSHVPITLIPGATAPYSSTENEMNVPHVDVADCTNLTVQNLKVVGSLPQSMTGLDQAAYADYTAFMHGFNIRGCDNVEIVNCTVDHVRGDFICMQAKSGSSPNIGIWVHDNTFQHCGRQAISFTAVKGTTSRLGALVENNTLSYVRRASFDVEPNHATNDWAEYITIRYNTIRGHTLNVFNLVGGSPNGIHHIRIVGNRVTRSPSTVHSTYDFGWMNVITTPGAYTFGGGNTPARTDIVITDNTAEQTRSISASTDKAVIELDNVNGFTVARNTQQCANPGTGKMYGVISLDCSGTRAVSGNTFTGADDEWLDS